MSAAARCLLAAAAAVSLATAAADAAVADPVATLAPVAAPANFGPTGPVHKYVTRLHQGSNDLNTPRGPLYIPDGQCSGVLDSVLFCPDGSSRGVEVVAEDVAPYPVISMSNDLQHGTVMRAAPCAGQAVVRVKLDCVY